MIPKILHYVWVGSSKPKKNYKYSVVNLHPDFQVIDHNEEILDNEVFGGFRAVLREAYQTFTRADNKADLIKLASIYIYGGVYCDYDVEAIKPWHNFLDTDVLFVKNSDSPLVVGEHIIGAEPKNAKIKQALEYFATVKPYDGRKYSPQLARWNYYHSWFAHPKEVFCPYNRYEQPKVFDNTHAIHHWGSEVKQ